MRVLFISIIYSVLLIVCCSCTTTQPIHGIPNLKQVESNIWRGGQPNAEGWQHLKTNGVTIDIKLNTESEASDSLAISNGLIVLSFPISVVDQTIGKPKTKELHNIVNTIAYYKSKNMGVFIHCQHGQDRTGLVSAEYRVLYDNWSKRDAEKEMFELGFHPWLRGLYWSWEEDVP